MYLVIGLPQALKAQDVIWVVVDRLTKIAHFIPIKVESSIEKLTELYIQEIVRLRSTNINNVRSRFALYLKILEKLA